MGDVVVHVLYPVIVMMRGFGLGGVVASTTTWPDPAGLQWSCSFVFLVTLGLLGIMMGSRLKASKKRELELLALVETRTSELEDLAGLVEKINAGRLPDEILQFVFDSFRPTIPYDRIGFAVISEDGTRVRTAWAQSDAENLEIIPGFELPLKKTSLRRVLQSKKPRILNDLPTYLREHPLSEGTRRIVVEGIRSSLTCPLKTTEKAIGFLFFSSREKDTYRDAHVRFFSQIAAQLSLAIQKSRLYEDLLETRNRLEEANRALESLASRDDLTGLVNRRVLDERLREEWRRSIRSGLPLSLMMIDIDYFKLFNDSLGHLEGDRCLRRVAEELQLSFQRADECVGRYGGEEFMVIFPNTASEEVQLHTQRFVRNLKTLKIQHPDSPVNRYVTVSIGIATVIPGAHGGPDTLVDQADRALYLAKGEGRNCVRIAGNGA